MRAVRRVGSAASVVVGWSSAVVTAVPSECSSVAGNTAALAPAAASAGTHRFRPAPPPDGGPSNDGPGGPPGAHTIRW
ncbi:hypothetical protein Sya03_47120 [Spirilliplanes yamanashiensis]|uniref:Uncharacterized protein n=1 Tax=Spirilliplanes yamanashiensis TaxID=42233 RepID=A0A8J3YCB4_9ACTN|nr:hypothetical protein Sya03_47120 [Spirilliplanes yamanashiensis]